MATDENTVRIAILETQITALGKTIDDLAKKIETLTAVMNKGRGAFALALFISGTAGAGFATAIAHFIKS